MRTKVQIQKEWEYAGHRGSVYALVLSDDKQRLYSAGDDGMVVEWQLSGGEDAETGKALLRISGGIYALGLLDAQQLLVVGGSTGTLYFIDLKSNRILHQYARSRDAIYGIWPHAPSNTIWVLHGGGYLSVLRDDTFEEVSFRRLSPEHLRTILSDPQTGRVYLGASDNHILVLEGPEFKLRHRWQAHESSVFSLLLLPQSRLLLSGGRDAHLKVWDVDHDFQLLKSLPAHNFTINDFALSPNGQYFATASRDKTVKIWDVADFQLLKVVDFSRHQGHTHSVNRLFWPEDELLISAGDDRRIIRWHIQLEEHAS